MLKGKGGWAKIGIITAALCFLLGIAYGVIAPHTFCFFTVSAQPIVLTGDIDSVHAQANPQTHANGFVWTSSSIFGAQCLDHKSK